MKFVLVNDITMYGIGTEIFCLFKLLKQSRYKKLFRSNKTLIFWRPFWNEFFGFFDQNFSRSSISQSWRRYDSPFLPNIASKFDYFAQNIALNFDFCHHIALILSFCSQISSIKHLHVILIFLIDNIHLPTLWFVIN